MSSLPAIKYVDEICLSLWEIQKAINPTSNTSEEQIIIDQSKSNIYYTPFRLNENYQKVHSHYVSAYIRVHKLPNGEECINYRNPIILYTGSFKFAENSRENDKKIADFICHSILDFAIESIDTKARLEMWMLQKDNSYRLASCFVAGKKILEEDYQQGLLTKEEVEVVYLDYQYFYKLYKLIDDKWWKIKDEFKQDKRFLFNSSLELFQEIILVYLDNDYKLFLKPDSKHDKKTNKKIYSLLKEIESLSSKSSRKPHSYKNKIKRLQQLMNPYRQTNYWLEKIIELCQKEAKEDQYIKKYIADTNALTIRKFQIMQGRKFKKFPTRTMIDGVFYPYVAWKDHKGEIRRARNSNKS